MSQQPRRPSAPYIPASQNLPEITLKVVILSIVLSIVLGAANTYLGLFAGMTVSASIPASVISMAVFRLFRKSNILENNIVQTVASAGESVAGGVIFTIPALVIMGTWQQFNYWETTLIAAMGGILGMLFTIPLRRAMIVEDPLQFPEGIATAEVLKVGERGGAGVKAIAIAGAIGAIYKLGQTGFRLWTSAFESATYTGRSIAYFGTDLSPALVAVGYIVGLNIAMLVFIGGAINWWIAIPILSAFTPQDPSVPALDVAYELWSTQTRYIGVGAMVVGGLWALVQLRKSLLKGLRSSMEAYRHMRTGGTIARTERDVPIQWMALALVLAIIPLYFIARHITGLSGISVIIAVLMLVSAFLFSAVAAYMAGVVGSSNSPISGVTIATIMCSSLLLLLVMGSGNMAGPAAAILIGAVVCNAAALAGDNMQDLASGRILGATPWKQQVMNTIGIIAAALIMAPTLTLLNTAYGIGAPTPEHPDPLPAPQANLMASVAKGIFQGGIPMNMVLIGAALAAVVIFIDSVLKSRGSSFRVPVLAMAIGIYLPFELAVPIAFGGVIAWIAGRRYRNAAEREEGERNGTLCAAGLITGEALVGIVMAIPIVLSGSAEVFAFSGVHNVAWPGVLLLGLVLYWLYHSATKRA